MGINPFTTVSDETQLVDKTIGTAYKVVRHVSEHIEYIKHVSAHLAEVYRVAGSIDAVDAIVASTSQIEGVYANLVNMNFVGDNIAAVAAVYEDLAKILEIHGSLTELLEIQSNLAALLSITDTLVDIQGRLNTAEDNIGDRVVGPASATHDNIAVFNGTTGKLVKNSSKKLSDFQLASMDLSAIANLVSAANKIPYATGPGAWSLADFSETGRTLLASASISNLTNMFSSFASIATSTISASTKRIQTEYYDPTYTNYYTLAGGGIYRRASLVDILALGFPASSYTRSLDRFMPDDSIDETNGGYWLLDLDNPYAECFGAVGNDVADDYQPITDGLAYVRLRNWKDIGGGIGGGGVVRLRALRYAVGSQIQVNSRSGIEGIMLGEGPFLSGSNVNGTSLRWIGTTSTTVSVVRLGGGYSDTNGYADGIVFRNVAIDGSLKAGRCLELMGTQGAIVHNWSATRATLHQFIMSPRNDNAPGCHHNNIQNFWISASADSNGFTKFMTDKSVSPSQGGCAFNYVAHGKIVHTTGWGFRDYGGDDNIFINVHIARSSGAGKCIWLGGGTSVTKRAAQGNKYLWMHVAGGSIGTGGDIYIEGYSAAAGGIEGNINRCAVGNILELSGVDGAPVIEQGENTATEIVMTGSYAIDTLPYRQTFPMTVSNFSYTDGAYIKVDGYGANYPRRILQYSKNAFGQTTGLATFVSGNVIGRDEFRAMVNTTTKTKDLMAYWELNFSANPSNTSYPVSVALWVAQQGYTVPTKALEVTGDGKHVSINRLLSLKSHTVSELEAMTGITAGSAAYCTDGDAGSPCIAIRSGSAWKRVVLGANIAIS